MPHRHLSFYAFAASAVAGRSTYDVYFFTDDRIYKIIYVTNDGIETINV